MIRVPWEQKIQILGEQGVSGGIREAIGYLTNLHNEAGQGWVWADDLPALCHTINNFRNPETETSHHELLFNFSTRISLLREQEGGAERRNELLKRLCEVIKQGNGSNKGLPERVDEMSRIIVDMQIFLFKEGSDSGKQDLLQSTG